MKKYAQRAQGKYVFNGAKNNRVVDPSDSNYQANYNCMVCNCYNEAGNQNNAGQVNVGKVVMTRSRLPRVFPYNGDGHSLCDIIRDPKQFSWLNKGFKKMNVPSSSRCFETAKKAMLYTDGLFADHYYAVYIKPPKWAKYMDVVQRPTRARDDLHIFLMDRLTIRERENTLPYGGSR